MGARWTCLSLSGVGLLTFAAWPLQSPRPETITIDARAPTPPFPHFWGHMFGSGPPILSLRDSYRQELRAVKAITGLEYIRFHAIFHDEIGLYDEDAQGRPIYN